MSGGAPTPVFEADGDLAFYYGGAQRCSPCHGCGPIIRDHYLIHFILAGRGIFLPVAGEAALGRGQAFLMRPDQLVHYRADREDPWHYLWIAFGGRRAGRLAGALGFDGRGVGSYGRTAEIARAMKQLIGAWSRHEKPFLLMSGLYRVFAALEAGARPGVGVAREGDGRQRVDRAIATMYRTFSGPVAIGDLASGVGLSRTHFFTLFSRVTGRSPRDFLRNLRLERSVDLLRRPELPIGEVARLVGYADPLFFSRQFRKQFGSAPRAWRERHRMRRTGAA